MGVCRCRKRTNLFCFNHSKAVCSDCLGDHPTCYVSTYVDWLTDSKFDAPRCHVSFPMSCLCLSGLVKCREKEKEKKEKKKKEKGKQTALTSLLRSVAQR